jgi:integrase
MKTNYVFQYPARAGTPWKVDIPASIAGRRIRRFFAEKRTAEMAVAVLLGDLKRKGTEGASITNQGPTVNQALNSYMQDKHVSPRYLGALKYHCSRMEADWGPRAISGLTVLDVERFVRRPTWGPRSRWNALGAVRTFLAWAQRRDLIQSNPAQKLAAEMRRPDARKEILSVEEMRLLLELTQDNPEMRAFVCLGGFAGVRTAEIQRLEWRDLDFENKEIHVRPDVIKKTRRGWRERYVRMEPTFLRHCPTMGVGRIVPRGHRTFGLRFRALRDRMAAALESQGNPGAARWREGWPDNCLRHSFASYHLAIREDAAATAYQMGHTSPITLYREYARAVRRSDADRWWAL